MNEYWFYLESDVFIVKKKQKIILYNSRSKEIMYVHPCTEVLQLIDRLLDPDELYVTLITSSDLENEQVYNFVHTIRKSYFGDLMERSENVKPVIIPPILKIHKSKDTIHKDAGFNIGKNIVSNLNEVVLYINGECNQKCMFCNNMYRQFVFCTKNTGKIHKKYIKNILNVVKKSSCRKLIITGGNIFEYPALVDFLELITQDLQNEIEIEVGVHYLNFDMEKYNCMANSEINISIYITFPINQTDLVMFLKHTGAISDRITYNFIVKEEKELMIVQKLIDENQIENKSIIRPFYDEKNDRFFEDYVFFDEKDIQNSFPSKQEIFAKQSFNTYDFGRLIINSNGEIQANVNYPAIGYIGDKFADIIYKEFTEGKSWFRIRDQAPCNDCVYQWFCPSPSPSNYEIVIGRPNLCKVKR